jgi:putative hydrolase of the HAD superfamily
LSRFSLITVDLDDTLWPGLPPIVRAEEAVYHWLGRVAERLVAVHDLESLRAHRRGLMRDRPEIAHDLTAVRQESLRQLLREFGYQPELAQEGCRIFLSHRSRVHPYADVVPVLQALSEDHCLVSLTNGNTEVERTPLRGIFDFSFDAAGVGAAKPDPRLFRAAMERTGSAPRYSLHVGDEPFLDVEAARRVGMSAVWVNRGARVWPAELEPPNAEVLDLNELQRWVKAQSSGV